jgi:hypothetical protein
MEDSTDSISDHGAPSHAPPSGLEHRAHHRYRVPVEITGWVVLYLLEIIALMILLAGVA